MSFKTREHLIIHDYFENFGGGERLIKVLYNTKMYDLIYGFDKNNLVKKINLHKNSLNLNKKKIPIILKKFLLKKKFANLNIKKNYKTCLLSGNYSIFSRVPKNCKKIFYCHSLPKIFFEFKKFYKSTNMIKKIINLTLKKKFKDEYIKKIKSMDILLCNSFNIKKKIKKFTNLNAKVVYPPIETKKFRWISQKKYFVSNNRHEIGKNLDKVISAFKNFPDINIYLTSQGSQTNHLKKIARHYKNIIFTGFLSDKRYANLIGNCCATINITSNEDFGMAALEGLAAGKPAIVINQGGYQETIKNNYNGFIMNKIKLEKNLINFLKNIDLKKLYSMKLNCISTTKKYSSQNFIKKILKFTS
jgi:glycosyltransferase involved in cell wall biosynthesis